MVVSLAGFTGACYQNTFLIWVLPICLFVMFFIITALLGFFIFAYVVAHKGLGSPVLNCAYSGYYLQDCSGWLKDQVASDSYWHKISSCTRYSKVCGKMGRSINGVPETGTVDLSGHNFPHPSQSSPRAPSSSPQVYTETTFEKGEKISPGLVRGLPSYGSPRRVDQVLPSCCINRSFNKPELVQPPSWPGPGSTRWADPGSITLSLVS